MADKGRVPEKVKRLPDGVAFVVYDPVVEGLLIEAVQALVRGAHPRRCRRLVGMLKEFRDEGGTPAMCAFYHRLVGEAFLDAIAERK